MFSENVIFYGISCVVGCFRYTVLSHNKCTTPVRQTAFSKDGTVLICVCDDATVWRWDRIAPWYYSFVTVLCFVL